MEDLAAMMRRTCLFSHLSGDDFQRVLNSMERVEFHVGDQLGAAEGEPTDALFVVVRGEVERYRLRQCGCDIMVSAVDKAGPNVGHACCAHNNAGTVGVPQDGRSGSTPRPIVEVIGANSYLAAFGTLHALSSHPSFATTTARTDGLAYRLPGRELNKLFAVPSVGLGVAQGLCAEMFKMRVSELYKTPLLEQPPQAVNVAAVSVAAAFEAYYRSAMNSLMNAALINGFRRGGTQASTGVHAASANRVAAAASVRASLGPFFPNMHVQIPTRVAYINGFKATRTWLNDKVNEVLASQSSGGALALGSREAALLRLAPALLPGLFMTPASGLLEACNAGAQNPEPLWRRSFRGLAPRAVREIIFGVGLNQLSDYCEERVPPNVATSKVARNALGSVCAGLVAGYLSHVPHNLSQMKLLSPTTSYARHFDILVDKAERRLPVGLPVSLVRPSATLVAVAWPTGIVIRSTQIVGSFVLLNGISHLLDVRLWDAVGFSGTPS